MVLFIDEHQITDVANIRTFDNPDYQFDATRS